MNKDRLTWFNGFDFVVIQLNNCVLIGDKGYLSQQYQQDLFETSNIKVETPMRNNNANFKPFPRR